MANIQSTATGNSGHRDALCPFGKKKKKTNRDIGKKTRATTRWSVRAIKLSGITENELLNSI